MSLIPSLRRWKYTASMLSYSNTCFAQDSIICCSLNLQENQYVWSYLAQRVLMLEGSHFSSRSLWQEFLKAVSETQPTSWTSIIVSEVCLLADNYTIINSFDTFSEIDVILHADLEAFKH